MNFLGLRKFMWKEEIKVGERYLVTGVQLGLFEAMGKINNSKKIKELVDEIIDKQFVGNTQKPILEDVKLIRL